MHIQKLPKNEGDPVIYRPNNNKLLNKGEIQDVKIIQKLKNGLVTRGPPDCLLGCVIASYHMKLNITVSLRQFGLTGGCTCNNYPIYGTLKGRYREKIFFKEHKD